MGKIKTISEIKKAFEDEDYELLTEKYENQHQKLDYICPNGHKSSTTWKGWVKGSRCFQCCRDRERLTIEFVRSKFEEDGYTLLEDTYINNKTKMRYKCPNGHESKTDWANWVSGYRCRYCAGNVKLDIDFIIREIGKEDYTLIEGVYKNNKSKLVLKCKDGHVFDSFWNNWRNGKRCPICYKNRVNIDVVRKSFEDEHYKLLSETYESAHGKLRFICPNNHKHEISWAAWKQGERCYYCRNDKNRLPIEEIRRLFEEEGYTFIDISYYSDKLKYICPKGHVGEISLGNWRSGNRCSHCYGNAKLTFDYVKDKIESEGYTVLSDGYKNNRDKLHLVCPNNHDYFASWFDWNSNCVRCYKCKEIGTSIQEQEIITYLKGLNGLNIEVHDRYLISPFELDIIVPEKKTAIEYCGLYWHSEVTGKRSKGYHIKKLHKCMEKGYKLITIFEDELVYKKNIVFSRLGHLLGYGSENVIYARNCSVKEVSTYEASKFCNDNHLQGYSGASVKLGAFFKDKLVAVATFSRPSISKGRLGDKKTGVWELNRFCTDIDLRVIGIASKLLKHFNRNYEWTTIFSYADRRWSTGNLYESIGFTFSHYTDANYWYIKPGVTERKHRFLYRKAMDEPKDIPEWELRKSQGLDRIWDCGSIKYVYHR